MQAHAEIPFDWLQYFNNSSEDLIGMELEIQDKNVQRIYSYLGPRRK